MSVYKLIQALAGTSISGTQSSRDLYNRPAGALVLPKMSNRGVPTASVTQADESGLDALSPADALSGVHE